MNPDRRTLLPEGLLSVTPFAQREGLLLFTRDSPLYFKTFIVPDFKLRCDASGK